jgi:hypothetical protein
LLCKASGQTRRGGAGVSGSINYVIHHDVFAQWGAVSASVTAASYTLAAVPEPATSTMTLLGSAVVAGAAALRRRRLEPAGGR